MLGCGEEGAKEKKGERLRLPGRLLMAGNHVIGWATTTPGVTVLSFMTSSLGWAPAQCLLPGINTSWQQLKSPCLPALHPSTSTHRPDPAQQGARGKSAEPLSLSTALSLSDGGWSLCSNSASCPSLQARQLGPLRLPRSSRQPCFSIPVLAPSSSLPCQWSPWHNTIGNRVTRKIRVGIGR